MHRPIGGKQRRQRDGWFGAVYITHLGDEVGTNQMGDRRLGDIKLHMGDNQHGDTFWTEDLATRFGQQDDMSGVYWAAHV